MHSTTNDFDLDIFNFKLKDDDMIGRLGNIQSHYEIEKILHALKENKKTHVEDYKIACEEYEKEKLKRAKAAYDAISAGRIDFTVASNFGLIAPQNCEKEYDKLIRVFGSMNGASVELSMNDADNIFNDSWDWVSSAKMLNASYTQMRR